MNKKNIKIINGGGQGQDDNNMYVRPEDYVDTMNKMLEEAGIKARFSYKIIEYKPYYLKAAKLYLQYDVDEWIETEILNIEQGQYCMECQRKMWEDGE